jgi:cell wall-active antibiotic response 4TMS protein YvqF
VQVAISRRRGVSGLGILLVLVGTVILLVSFAKLPSSVYELWPLILVGVGLVGLVRRPGWIQELDLALPGAGDAAPGARRAHTETHRPRRGFSLFLIGSGLFLLLLTTHVVDRRLIGPGLLIALGLLLLWRRSR